MTPARSTMLLRAPTLLIMILFMILPMAVAVVYSFMTKGPYGGVQPPATFAAYQQLLFQEDFDGNLVFSPAYLIIFWRSVWLATLTVLISLAIGLPMAWYIACRPVAQRGMLLLLVTLPFWINTLIRTYCWVLILRDEGLLNIGLRNESFTNKNADGIAFVKAVKQLPNYKFTPIIMLTTESQEDKKMEGQAAGAKAWVVKPFKPEQMLAAVAKLVLP
jgi:ABC-type spermidine/putrescine transport system permease subunit I